jgi:hypothetical protein
MENKQKLKNLLIKQLENDSVNEKLITILQGAPLQGELSQGEIYMLTMFLPLKRHKEFLEYTGTISFYSWVQLYQESKVEKIDKLFFEKMRTTANTFTEKLMLMTVMEEISETDFEETLVLVQNADDCLALLNEVDIEGHIRRCLEKLIELEVSIDIWCEVEENAFQFDCSHLVRIIAMEEMVKKAEEKPNLPNWIKVYDHTLSGSENDKLAIEKIDGFRMDFEYWAEVYEKEKRQHAKATGLAIQKMQKLEGNYEYWLNLLYNPEAVISRQDIQKTCLTMMQKLKGTPVQYHATWEWISEAEDFDCKIDGKINFLLKIMQATDKKA